MRNNHKCKSDLNTIEISLVVLTFLYLKAPGIVVIYYIFKSSHTNSKNDYILLSLSIALMAYSWDIYSFQNNFDLRRHHEQYYLLQGMEFTSFLKGLSLFNPLQSIILYLLTVFKDPNLVQFSVVYTGIRLILHHVASLSFKNSHMRLYFLVTILSSFRLLYFISGLWNLLAIIIFFYAVVDSDIKILERRLLFLAAILLHSSMIIPVIFYLYCTNTKNLNNMLTIMFFSVFLLAFLFLTPVVSQWLYDVTRIKFFYFVNTRFTAYFKNGDQFLYLANNKFYLVELSKIIYVFFLAYISKKLKLETEEKQFSLFLIFLSLFTIIIGYQSRVFMRFSSLILMLGISFFKGSTEVIFSIKKDFNKKLNKNIVYSFILVCFTILQLMFELYSLWNAKIIGGLL